MRCNYLSIFLFCCLFNSNFFGQVVYSDPQHNFDIESGVYFFEDINNSGTINEMAVQQGFIPITKRVNNFGITSSAIWFKLPIKNLTNFENLILLVNQPIIDEIEFYFFDYNKKKYESVRLGEYKKFSEREYQTPEYLFDLPIPKDSVRTFYLKVRSKENLQVPMSIGTRISTLNKSVKYNLASGIYFGIMIVMILYNLFIYSILRDRSYIIYSIYIMLILLTQTSLQGYTFQLIWPNSPFLATYSPFIFPALVGVLGLEFFKQFLRIKERSKLAFRISLVFLFPYALSVLLGFIGFFGLSFMLMEMTAGFVSIFMLIVAFVIYRQGVSEARFFLLGWSVFLLGICIYVLKDFEVLPYNGFTRYTMHFGSAVEVILLSFALADRINILKKESEGAHAEALKISGENQKLISDQNIFLEQKVHARTIELEETNEELNVTLSYLKDTQAQLVDAEKMASLGQLTAGIAHEINNPINFVSANLKPLRLDISEVLEVIKRYETLVAGDDLTRKMEEIEAFKKRIDLEYLKEEINGLLKGIEDGAKRTSEIVSGLKNFSRLDESEIKEANINDGIESTLILIRSSVPKNADIITDLGRIPYIECYPGKLNQVFMNIISNAIYAVKQRKKEEHHKIIITTCEMNDQIHISFQDTGIGMTKDIKEKIFEPFFTTKDVGEGTGLGMSIVYKIIESHNARIEVESEPNVGTNITVILNKRLS